jgi:hypothetical protein
MAQTPTERLSANIRAAADERNVPLTGLAAALGIGRSTLYRRLDDAEGWTYAELIRASQIIGVPLAALIDGVEELYAAETAGERSA